MNQISSVGFGSDITVMAAYAQAANDKLGPVDFQFENTGNTTAVIRLMTYDGSTAPSGFAAVATATQQSGQVAGAFTVAPGGAVTRGYSLLNKRLAFFGSGNTTVNITPVYRNKGDLRGAQIDIVTVGRKNWKFDDAFNKGELTKKWGSIDAGQGNVNPATNNPSYDGGRTQT